MQRKTVLLMVVAPLVAWGAAAWALDHWGHRATPAGADCIVVLGARVVPPGVAGPSLRKRAEKAAELYHAGAAAHIICTGGVGDTPPAESIAATAILLQRGVPAGAIEREEVSTSTWENAGEATTICRAHGWKRIILVSDGYHLWRATHNFRRMGLQAEPAMAADPPPAGRTRMALRETLLVVRDAFTGRL